MERRGCLTRDRAGSFLNYSSDIYQAAPIRWGLRLLSTESAGDGQITGRRRTTGSSSAGLIGRPTQPRLLRREQKRQQHHGADAGERQDERTFKIAISP